MLIKFSDAAADFKDNKTNASIQSLQPCFLLQRQLYGKIRPLNPGLVMPA
jgi:hypothetical protein